MASFKQVRTNDVIIFHFKREDRHVECRHIHIIIVRKEASMTIILYVCTRISAAMKLLLLGIRSKVHSGYEINIWQDPWIPSTPTRSVRPRAPVVNPKMIVSSLINFESKEWDARLLAQYSRSRGHTDDSEYGHKPYSSTGYLLLELHQKWPIHC